MQICAILVGIPVEIPCRSGHFFVLWSLHISVNLQIALLFAGWINILLGDPLCWELCYLIKKFIFSEISLKKAYYELRAMLNMNNTNEAFGAFKKNNLRSRTCTTEGDITNWSCKDGINPYRYINKVKISVYIQFWHQSWTNPSLEKQPCHPLYS